MVLNVGHGNCSFIHDGSTSVVVDVPNALPLLGAMASSDADVIEHLILSHADNDHIKGAAALMAHSEVVVKSLWVNPDSTKLSDAFLDLLTVAADRQSRGLLNVRTNLNVGADGLLDIRRIGVRILHPGIVWAGIGPTGKDHPSGPISSNGMSAVVRIELDGQPAVLLPGDLDSKGFSEMRKAQVDMKAPVLVFPHHGGRSGAPDNRAFAADLATAVKPRLVIFSHGRTHFMNPRKEIIDGIRDALGSDVQIACTQISRACHEKELPLISAQGDLLSGQTACAGSVRVTRTDDGILWEPHASRHAQTIDVLESPLCRSHLRGGLSADSTVVSQSRRSADD
ncbi:MBL fold metallo-hydrolase [Streptomyces sp. NPDC049949]|uniref:ComEC/Rec2 family competence protein n=1 Tax=Streptomyces sp. NPDC049949 TaxID=3154627 RepID=UPI0034323433